MDLVGELQHRAEEWLIILEEGCKQLWTIVGVLTMRQQEGEEIDGGAISMDQWLEDRTQEMLDIMWELEEGPDPRLDAYIDWRRADDRMGACKALFTMGRNLRNQLEIRKGKGEMGDKGDRDVWVEGGVEAGEENCGDNTNNSKNNNNNNINNNIGIKDIDCDNNNNINDNDGDNINNNNNNNNDDGGSDDHGSSRAESGARASEVIISMMAEMLQADVVGIGADMDTGFAIFPPFNDNDGDNNNNNNNNDDEGGATTTAAA
ncbi:hypothetical protein CBR_g34180 [Chara braunii]|uniref:Uncharacterized protein n=1 Tax=Chara braunii TaxID=69332 RepID=A0A388LI46_CHABU|nr:hypothetical protein CBR_g34180 [Chara braunii]|eukprot:GBG82000.1 hypothetical protein CBR_g34180 [Chara braunii]